MCVAAVQPVDIMNSLASVLLVLAVATHVLGGTYPYTKGKQKNILRNQHQTKKQKILLAEETRIMQQILRRFDMQCGKETREQLIKCSEQESVLRQRYEALLGEWKQQSARRVRRSTAECDAATLELVAAQEALNQCRNASQRLESALAGERGTLTTCSTKRRDLASLADQLDAETLSCQTNKSTHLKSASELQVYTKECDGQSTECSGILKNFQDLYAKCSVDVSKYRPSGVNADVTDIHELSQLCTEELMVKKEALGNASRTVTATENARAQTEADVVQCQNSIKEMEAAIDSTRNEVNECLDTSKGLDQQYSAANVNTSACASQLNKSMVAVDLYKMQAAKIAKQVQDEITQKAEAVRAQNTIYVENKVFLKKLGECRSKMSGLKYEVAAAKAEVDKYASANPTTYGCETLVSVPSDTLTRFSENGKVYLIGPSSAFNSPSWMRWSDAQNYCKQNGMALLTLSDSAELDMLANYVRKVVLGSALFGQIDYWVGAYDFFEEGEFSWIATGEYLSRPFFIENNDDDKDFAYMSVSTVNEAVPLRADTGQVARSFICELPAPCSFSAKAAVYAPSQSASVRHIGFMYSRLE